MHVSDPGSMQDACCAGHEVQDEGVVIKPRAASRRESRAIGC